tara:strand:+ start:444 stop:1730 length:1287 start_codon:yes stop_codon:yes gene_type:complete
MNFQDFFNPDKVVDLSFFNFENAITACYYADIDLRVKKVNKNFKSFFPVLGNVKDAYFPDILKQLGVSQEQIDFFESEIREKGSVLIPKVKILIENQERLFSLLSTKTKNKDFEYLNGIQGQFVDRTNEYKLTLERDQLIESQLNDKKLIEEKSKKLESLATRLAKYLSPQIYKNIFDEEKDQSVSHSRKNLTVFFSDIVAFTDLTDKMEPEKLAAIINSYLSEMSTIAIKYGGTIDKFIGDALMVFFGDPETLGETNDALKCIEMAIAMQNRVAELQSHWKNLGAANGISVRMGISNGFCTVGNFGSDLRLDYTILGSPVNLAARLQSMAEYDQMLVDENTKNLIESEVKTAFVKEYTPKGFARPIGVFRVDGFKSQDYMKNHIRLSHKGKRVEINVIDSSDIRAAIEELKSIQESFEKELCSKEEN